MTPRIEGLFDFNEKRDFTAFQPARKPGRSSR